MPEATTATTSSCSAKGLRHWSTDDAMLAGIELPRLMTPTRSGLGQDSYRLGSYPANRRGFSTDGVDQRLWRINPATHWPETKSMYASPAGSSPPRLMAQKTGGSASMRLAAGAGDNGLIDHPRDGGSSHNLCGIKTVASLWCPRRALQVLRRPRGRSKESRRSAPTRRSVELRLRRLPPGRRAATNALDSAAI